MSWLEPEQEAVFLGIRRLVADIPGDMRTSGETPPEPIASARPGWPRNAPFPNTPEELGLKRATMDDIRGGATPAESAAQVRAVLSGESGPKRDMVLLNAGTALMAAGKAADIPGGMALAREMIDSGAALAKLDALAAFTRG